MPSNSSGAQKRKRAAKTKKNEKDLLSKMTKVSAFFRTSANSTTSIDQDSDKRDGKLSSYDYKAGLKRLLTNLNNEEVIQRELAAMPKFDLAEPIPITMEIQLLTEDEYSNKLLAKYCASLYATHRAVKSSSNGNCLFNSASILLTGTEQMADELRVRTCIEMIADRPEYESRDEILSLSPDYDEALRDCAKGGDVGVWAICALASVIHRDIRSVYPVMEEEKNFKLATEVLNATFCPIQDMKTHDSALYILWTRVNSDGPFPWNPSHFVPLLGRIESTNHNNEEKERETCDNFVGASDDAQPPCWSEAQCNYFKEVNSWLIVNAEKLGCSSCKEVYDSGSNASSNVGRNFSEEWTTCKVSFSAASKMAQQSSLRKKICGHRQSDGHIKALKLIELKNSESLKASVAVQTMEQQKETCNVFRTAYYVAKSDRPYTDHPKLVLLQQLNGVDLGRILHSNVTCSEIIDHISVYMRKSLTDRVLEHKPAISVLVDESTSLGRATCLIVYIRTVIDKTIGPVTFFLDIVELDGTTAEDIETCLLNCLSKHGFDAEFLKGNWLALGSDGASVMLGTKAGLAARLKIKFSNLISWHCFNHRLELSVHDAVKSCTEVNNFKIFLDSIYAIYSMSPKCQRELNNVAKDLEVQIQRIGKVLDTRWVASSHRTVKAVWNSYAALHSHFSRKTTDASSDSREKAKFSGFKKKLENPVFIKNLGLMNDALEELADLSLALQKSDISLPVAHRLISRQVEVFQARKEYDSQCYKEACTSVSNGIFKGVSVSASNGKEREIRREQFYQCLADSMAARMFPEEERTLCSSLNVLDCNKWSDNLSAEYGEDDLKILCEKFRCSFSQVKSDYRNFKDSRGLNIGNSLKTLLNAVNTVPVSTAECERGFSRMNLICTPLRSKLSVSHFSSLLFISLTGPPLKLFKPLPYVRSWLISRRDATCVQCPAAKEKSFDTAKKSVWDVL